jgi:mitogen-activated protein kinase 1/3
MHVLFLVFEFVDTDLYKLIMSPQFLTTEHIQTFLYQLLIGLKYIHSFSIIHRDLKPANILLNEDCSLKICDFGLSRIHHSDNSITLPPLLPSDRNERISSTMHQPTCPEEEPSLLHQPCFRLTRQLTKHVVTRWYRAPELILIQPYTTSVDIWSLGCILAELLSMQEGSVPCYQDRMPLFPGQPTVPSTAIKTAQRNCLPSHIVLLILPLHFHLSYPGGSCFPLSADAGKHMGRDERLDQLSVIFSVIGTPCEEDVSSIGQVRSSWHACILNFSCMSQSLMHVLKFNSYLLSPHCRHSFFFFVAGKRIHQKFKKI